ncbi:uncharacterized protein PAC_12070 [Phialocephala subalpina]|uniref:Uncharacterized protein n=1 Tax=Phialocephala subalpina TaxID=576137 RepID=A0A1L7XAW8_9HELO|nr:uncharacterized protein PAC_12070 [Phialocephala subalpina]
MFQLSRNSDSPPPSPEGSLRPPFTTPRRPLPFGPVRPPPSDSPLAAPLNWQFPDTVRVTVQPFPPTITSPPPGPPPRPVITNHHMAEHGCKYCCSVAVCATHAIKEMEPMAWEEGKWEEELEVLGIHEKEWFRHSGVFAVREDVRQLHAKLKDKERERECKTKMLSLPQKGSSPFCCHSLEPNWDKCRMEGSSPQFFLLIKDLVNATPAKITMEFYETKKNFHKVKRIYKVNVFGQRGQSTWLFVNYHYERPSTNDGGPSPFFCFLYLDRALPFKPRDRYVTWDCKGSHPKRQYQIGIFTAMKAKVETSTGSLDWQTYGDEGLDRVMLTPLKHCRTLGITTIEDHDQALLEEHEAVEALIGLQQG